MLRRNLTDGGSQAWWQDLSHGAPTISALARLCSQALVDSQLMLPADDPSAPPSFNVNSLRAEAQALLSLAKRREGRSRSVPRKMVLIRPSGYWPWRSKLNPSNGGCCWTSRSLAKRSGFWKRLHHYVRKVWCCTTCKQSFRFRRWVLKKLQRSTTKISMSLSC